jgi:hypothetical protein
MDLLVYALGGLLISAFVLWWRPEVGWRAAVGYLLIAGAFYGVPLATSALQVGSDIPYVWRPWSETAVAGNLEGNRPLNPLLGDVPLQLVPYRALVRERLLDLEAPLWVHEVGTGAPLLGNGYSAPFSPLHLLALPLPAERSLTVAVAWQTLLALLLMHALLLALGARPPGAALAAVAYGFSAFQVVWAYHPHAMTAAWMPGALLGLVLLRRGERGAFAGLVVCGLGMALSGHPETLAHGALACAAVVLALLARPEGGPRSPFIGRLAAATVLTACLAAPVLLPVLEVLPDGERWQVVERVPQSVDPPPFRAAFLLLPVQPLLYGSPRDWNWDGPGNFNELCSGYAGVLALVVALAGAFVPLAAEERRRRFLLLAGALFALLASMGVDPFFWLVDSLPGMSHGAHARLRLLWVMGVAVAAGLGLGDLIQEKRGIRAGLVAAAAVALALVLTPAHPLPWQKAWWIAALTGVILSGSVLALPRLRRFFPVVALVVLGLDLTLLLVRYQPTAPGTFDLAAPPVLARVVEAAGQEGPFRVMAEGHDLKPDLGLLYGLWDPRGYDPMRPADAALVAGRGFLPRFKVGRELRLESRQFPVHAQRMFDYLGVRYILTRHQRKVPPPWEPAWNDTGGKVWRNRQALPLFFFPESARRVPDRQEAMDLAISTRDYRTFGVAHGEPAAGPRPQAGTVRIVEVLPNGFDLEVETATGGLVVSSVSDARGWRLEPVEGGGEPTLRRVNGGFVGFEIAPGRHRVRLDYRPSGWIWGLGMAGLGVLGMVGAVGLGIARRKRPLTP